MGAPTDGLLGDSQARVDGQVPVQVHVDTDVTTPDHHTLVLYDGDPAQGGQPIAGKTVPGVAAGGGADVTIDWRPTTPGVHHLVAQLFEDADDSQPGNNVAAVDVAVGDRALPAPTLQAVADAMQVTAMPAGMRTALVSIVKRAEQAQTAGRGVEVRALLQTVIGVLKGASGTLMSDHDAARILAAIQPLLGQ